MRVKKMLLDKGYKTFIDSPTNQQFFILPNDAMERLAKHIVFSRWAPYDDNSTVCRFVTSWSTKESDLEYLASVI